MRKLGAVVVLCVTCVLALSLLSSPAPELDFVDSQAIEIDRAGRTLGVSASEGEIGFDSAFAIATELGSSLVTLPMPWDELESGDGELNSSWLGIANRFYADKEVGVSLEINPIDTNVLRMPSQYASRLDESDVISAYVRVLEFAAQEVADLNVRYLVIGNEVDGYLSNETVSVSEYRTFLEFVIPEARRLFPQATIGVKTTFDGAFDSDIASLHALSDAVFLTHYMLEDSANGLSVRPPDDIVTDFRRITAEYQGAPVLFLELGYPSSEWVGSSKALQADFYTNAFSAWDAHSDDIPVLNILGVTDFPETDVDGYVEYYSFPDRSFAGFIGSLGLLTAEGEPKPAFEVVAREAKRRGF